MEIRKIENSNLVQAFFMSTFSLSVSILPLKAYQGKGEKDVSRKKRKW
jgi:hypothetical protein